VIDEESVSGERVRVSRGSVCGAWGGVAGTIRYFADRFGMPRAGIEGTQLPYDLMRSYARVGAAEVVYDPRRRRMPLVATRRRTFHGFELERDSEPLDRIPEDLAGAARGALVEAVMSGVAHHRHARHVRQTLERLGELWRRSAGTLGGVDASVIRAALANRLRRLRRFEDFLQADLALEVGDFVDPAHRRTLEALPSHVTIGGERCPLAYEVASGLGVARAHLPERLARSLTEADMPHLDRPLMFRVDRARGPAIDAASVAELRRALSGRVKEAGPGRRGRARRHRRKL
jgi:ATP-dependent helicase HrpA